MPRTLPAFPLLPVALAASLLPAAAAAQDPVVGDEGGPRIELGGELMWRGEVRDAADLTGPGDESNDPMRFRARVDARVAYDDYLELYLDAFGTVSDTGEESEEALHQAYAHAHRLWGDYDLRVGRFQIDLGDGRVVSSNPWEFMPNSFDGLQVMDGGDRHEWSVWWTEAANGRAGDQEDTFAGAWGAIPAGRRGVLEGYLLWRNQSMFDREEVTYVLRWSGETVHGLHWDVFGALQDGSDTGSLEILTEAVAVRVDKELDFGHHVGAEFALARGDTRPDDTDQERYDPVYIEHHAFNGKADVVAFSNLVDLALYYWMQWNERWSFHVDLHDFQRQNTDDDLILGYDRVAVPAADDSRAIGRELDLYLKGVLSSRFTVDLGAAWFDAGPAMPTDENQVWLFLHLVLDF